MPQTRFLKKFTVEADYNDFWQKKCILQRRSVIKVDWRSKKMHGFGHLCNGVVSYNPSKGPMQGIYGRVICLHVTSTQSQKEV